MDRNVQAEAVKRLIVALDVPTISEAERLVRRLSGHVGVFKIGLELLFAGGSELAARLAGEGHQVFVDAKLLDISNTVERATRQIASAGATFLTLHAHDRKTLEAALRGRGQAGAKLLGVTVLTHLSAQDIAGQGVTLPLNELVLQRARIARDAGLDGIVCSPREAPLLRRELGPDILIVTPGIRSAADVQGDQSRTATPAEALAAGADYLVVGRPITQAEDPAAAADRIAVEMADGLSR